jgi:hypothetical protein
MLAMARTELLLRTGWITVHKRGISVGRTTCTDTLIGNTHFCSVTSVACALATEYAKDAEVVNSQNRCPVSRILTTTLVWWRLETSVNTNVAMRPMEDEMFTVTTTSGFKMILESAGRDSDGNRLWRQIEIGQPPCDPRCQQRHVHVIPDIVSLP